MWKGTCEEGREFYYLDAERKAERLNEKLSQRLAEKNVDMLG